MQAGFVAVALAISLSGCTSTPGDDRPIAVPGLAVPKRLHKGDAAPFDGWLLSDPLFNWILPDARKRLTDPAADEPDQFLPPIETDDERSQEPAAESPGRTGLFLARDPSPAEGR